LRGPEAACRAWTSHPGISRLIRAHGDSDHLDQRESAGGSPAKSALRFWSSGRTRGARAASGSRRWNAGFVATFDRTRLHGALSARDPSGAIAASPLREKRSHLSKMRDGSEDPLRVHGNTAGVRWREGDRAQIAIERGLTDRRSD